MVKKSFSDVAKGMGPLNLFINCAGMAICGTLEDNSPSDIMVFSVNRNS